MREPDAVYAIYSSTLQGAKRLHDILARGSSRAKIRLARSWPEFERVSATASCGIVYLEWLDEQEFAALQTYREQNPLRPLILVSQHRKEVSRRLKDVRPDEVVWLDGMEASLLAAVARASSYRLFSILIRAVRADSKLPAILREGLTIAFKSSKPVKSLEELARLLGCARSTLRRQWSRAFGEDGSFSELLDWIILLRGMELKVPRRSWSSVADDLNIDRDTLSKIAVRLLDCRLRMTGPADQERAVRRFLGAYGLRFLGIKSIDVGALRL